VSFEVITNIKIVSLKDHFVSALASERRYFKIDIFAPEFAPPISTHVVAIFYPEVMSFTKNGDKIWLGKILVNDIQFAKFAKVFPRHNFVLYGIYLTDLWLNKRLYRWIDLT